MYTRKLGKCSSTALVLDFFLETKKFASILDEVSKVNMKNRITITISYFM